jgi:TetR/AcrR family tetracycline transcriptional repressor
MTKSLDSATKYPRHSRDDVVLAAIGILDEYGLPDLTMRRLAATLDVQPSALYWHVTNKQTLLALIADRILAGAPRTEHGTDWRRATRQQAGALRDALLAYRDGAEVVSSTLALGLGAEDAAGRLAEAIAGGGFDARTSELAADTLLHFILGHASHEQQRIQADSLGVVTPERSSSPDDVSTPTEDVDSFNFGVTLLLSGLDAQTRVRSDAH